MVQSNSLQEMHLLANSIRRTYNRLRHTTDQIHEATELSAPKRTLMMDIQREGPQTVPALAASRYVSRQIIQAQVNELSGAGLLQAIVNPEHKRSSLIALTAKGKRRVQQMIDDENAFIAQLGWLPDASELQICCHVLDAIYTHLEQDS
jgi:DNA-binding MarR family transcriptional regulator